MSKTIYLNKIYIYGFLDYTVEGSFKAALARNIVSLSTISAKEIFITHDLVLQLYNVLHFYDLCFHRRLLKLSGWICFMFKNVHAKTRD